MSERLVMQLAEIHVTSVSNERLRKEKDDYEKSPPPNSGVTCTMLWAPLDILL